MQTTTAWRAYVINLDQAKARWSYITRQLIDLGIPYARVEAVDGNSLKLPGPDVSERAFELMHGRLYGAETGCYFSHLKAIEQFLATGEEHGLILEDDALLSFDFKSLVDEAIVLGDDWDILRLGSVNSGKWFAVASMPSGSTLGVGFTRLKGAAAYVLNRKAARVFRERLLPMQLPYDIAFDLEFLWGLRALGVEPRPVEQNAAFETQIQTKVWVRRFSPWRYVTVFPTRTAFEIARLPCRAWLYLSLRTKHLMRGPRVAMERSQ